MIFENISLAIKALLSNKMRSILTMLGIIIGIASVITIMTIGDAMTESVNAAFAAFGTGNINVTVREQSAIDRNRQMQGGGGMFMFGGGGGRTFFGPQDYELISDVMIQEFREAFPNEIAGVVLTHHGEQGTARSGDLFANISTVGTNPDYARANNKTLLSGRFLSESDLEEKRTVAVVSDRFVSNMFPDGRDPIGEQVAIYYWRTIEIFTIIGVYRHEPMGFGAFALGPPVADQDIRTSMYIPITTAMRDIRGNNHRTMTVVAARGVDVIDFTDTIIDYFADVYRYNHTWAVDATNMETFLEEAMAALNAIAIAVAAIAAISLLVGGIGIMNIMLVSVTERTKEIGIRKALGAKNKHIRLQFITESAIIAAIGGIIGATIGTLLGLAAIPLFAMLTETDMELVISWGTIFISVAFSAVIGMFFGYYPANKAAKLNPIDALRYE